jgi:serine/threonine-protein kinase
MPPNRLGRYEVLGELGKGAMGVVYRARDPLIERAVAIKTFACGGLPAEEVAAFERRFFREARLAGGLSHPNIVTVYDVGRSGDLAYIAMELLDGQSLRQVLDSGAVLPVAQAAEMAAQVADGLAYAHAKGVVHRDIKPANLMVLDPALVKIADFGVAMLPAGSTTLAGAVFGSPKYMSPEQVAGKAVDGRSDIFSLGAVLYEMLAGLPAFAGDELTAILHQVLHAEPPPPSARRRDLPPAFDRIVARALAKDPAARYQNAADMAAELRRQIGPAAVTMHAAPGDATVPLAPVAAAGRLRWPGWRHPAVLAAGASVAMLVLVGLGGWLRPAAPIPAARTAVQPAEPVPAVADPPIPSAVSVSSGPPSPPPAPVRHPVLARTRTAAEMAPATLQLAVAPWGEIFIDGRKRGLAPPLTELQLPPGRHQLEVRNAGQRHRQTIVLAPRATVRVKHKFQ